MSTAASSNPFRQSPQLWKITFHITPDIMELVESTFGDLALAVSSFEVDEAACTWVTELLCEAEPSHQLIQTRLDILVRELGLHPLEWYAEEVQQQDWLGRVAQQFPPLQAGRFFVHGSHVTEPPPAGSIPLLVDAGAAFGSGEHATTYGCLLAIDRLAKRRKFHNMLDMGCGSGILAMGMAKIWHKPVLAVDVDAVAVNVTHENFERNKVAAWAYALCANGYLATEVMRRAPYDLIVANILAKPLMQFAPKLAEVLAPGGVAILSGLLGTQERMVLAAHRCHGIRLVGRVARNGWHTLIIGK